VTNCAINGCFEVKVVHVPFTFVPDPVGGTEIYVDGLARSLLSYGVESVIVAPSQAACEPYEYKGLRVRRFRSVVEGTDALRELYGAGDYAAATAFGRVLDEERADAVHLHAFTRAVSVLLVRAAKERELPVFFTYHTPTVSCQRGTLLLRGKQVCDGVLGVRRCTGCALEGHGLPGKAANILSHVPYSVGRALERAGLSGGIWTALRMTDLVRMRHAAIRALLWEVDEIVALKEWVRALLLENGVPASKITLSPHGLSSDGPIGEPPIDVAEGPLRVAFLGRTDRVKGVDTLINAVCSAPDLQIELHLYGVVQGAGDQSYWSGLQNLAARDGRITFFPAVEHEDVIPLLRKYHLLAVPSRWLETGPLVVLEAFAAGAPVLGSRLGGLIDWVRHGENGLLIEPESVPAWADALRRCAHDRPFVAHLRRGVRPPRSTDEVANDMATLYRRHAPTADLKSVRGLYSALSRNFRGASRNTGAFKGS